MGDTGESQMSPISNFRKGFSLIELSVALVVMGLLSAVAIPITINVSRNQKIMQAENELQNIRELLIYYYKTNGNLPAHEPNNTLPSPILGIPEQYKNDPIKGIPYLYFADTISAADTIYVDNTPLGAISAVIISAGPNGKFDGENATPSDGRFESTGTGDFDDILYYVCELDLTETPEAWGVCESYTLILRNKDVVENRALYARIIRDVATTYTIPWGQTLTISGLEPFACIQLSRRNNYGSAIEVYFFNISSYNEGNDCTVEVIKYSQLSGTTHPLITGDLHR